VKAKGKRLRKRDIAAAALTLYLLVLSLFVLFPRPILESGDPSQIAEYLRTHANFFYKILYADTHLVALGNFFMLFTALFERVSLYKVFLVGIALSASFELVQLAIPGRVSDWIDFLSNSLSLLIGIAIVRFLRSRKSA
jgi:glycopeptide antibiotics resistance protein